MNYIEKMDEIVKCCSDEFDFKLIEMSIDSFKDYVNSVVDYAVKIPLVRERYSYDLDRVKDEIKRFDQIRHDAHEAAIASLTSLNRFCSAHNLEKLSDVNTNDRYQVAEFVGNFVNQVYNDTIKGGMDKAVEFAQERGDEYRYPKYEIER